MDIPEQYKILSSYTSEAKNLPYLWNRQCNGDVLNGKLLVRCENKAINGVNMCSKCFNSIYRLKAKI